MTKAKRPKKPASNDKALYASAFEDGAIFSMVLLKGQVSGQVEALRTLKVDGDVGLVLNGIQNVLNGLLIRYENDLMKQIDNAKKKFEG